MLKLLLVYAGAGALAIQIAHRWVRPISIRGRLVLALLPLALTGRALFTGGYFGPLNLAYATPPLAGTAPELSLRHDDDGILSDLQIAILPWRKAVRDSVKSFRAPLLNRFSFCGDPLLGSFQPAPFHPGTVIGFLLPLATAWTFNGALTLLFAALFAFLLSRELGVREPCALFSGAAAMLAGCVVFWCEWPLGAAFVTFPLLALGLRRVARGEARGFPIAVAAWLLLILAGHPESIVHVTAAAGLLFLVEVVRARKGMRPVAVASAAGLLSLALAAPMLLPFAEILPETTESGMRKAQYAHQKKSVSLAEAGSSALGAVYPGSHGSMWIPSPPHGPRFPDAVGVFVGGLALALACLALASRRTDAWILGALALLCFAVAMGVPGITDVLSALPVFKIALNTRLAAIAAACVAVLSGMGLEASIERPRRAGIVLLSLSLAAFLGASRIVPVRAPRFATPAFGTQVLLLALPPAVLALLLVLSRRRDRLVVASAMGLFLASHLAEMPRLYPTFPSRLFYPRIPEIDALPQSGEPYRTTAAGYDLVPNQSALFGLEDPRGYQATNNARYQTTYGLWCVAQPVWFNRIDDLNRPFLSFLNVRFAIAGAAQPPPAGWTVYRRGAYCAVFENPRALPRAFVPASIRFVPDTSRTIELMSGNDDFAKTAWIEDARRAGEVAANGPARVTTARRGSDLEIRTEGETRSWVVVSQTFWKGWQAREAGRELPLFYANQAFLAFEVGPGVHHIRLAYRPKSFLLGIAFFLAGSVALLLGGIVFRSRRRPERFRRIGG